MRIGIKYCGGCNPRYDRVAEINKLKAEFPMAEFVAASNYPTECDIILIVCGCFAVCAERSGLVPKDEMIVMWQAADMKQVREKLRSVCPGWEDVVADTSAAPVGHTKSEETLALEAAEAESLARAKKAEQEEAARWMKMVMPLSGK